MTDQALDILKLVLLGLLYLFFARVLWAVWSEVRSGQQPRRQPPPHRPPASTTAAATVAAPVPAARRSVAHRPAKGRGGTVARLVVIEPKERRGRGVPARARDHGRPRPGVHDHDRRRHVRVAALHLRIYDVDGQAMVEDLGSTNGSFHNGNRLVRRPAAAPGRPHPGRLHGPGGAVVADAALGRGDRSRPHPARQRGQPPSPSRSCSASPTGWAATRPARSPAPLAVDLLRDPPRRRGADLESGRRRGRRGQRRRSSAAAIGNPDQQGMGTTRHRARRARADDRTDDRHGADAEQLALVNVGDSPHLPAAPRPAAPGHASTTATSRSSSPPATSPTTRRAPTRAATSSPARSASSPTVRVDAWTLPLVRGDRFLLCSDGLVDEVRDDEIVDVAARRSTDPQAAADELVALANRHGGRDNVTVIVVDVLDGADPPDADSELDLEPAWDDAGDGRRGGRRPGGRGHRRSTTSPRSSAATTDRRAESRRAGTPAVRSPTRSPATDAPAPTRRKRRVDRLRRRARRARRARPGARHRVGVRPARLLRRLRRRR